MYKCSYVNAYSLLSIQIIICLGIIVICNSFINIISLHEKKNIGKFSKFSNFSTRIFKKTILLYNI